MSWTRRRLLTVAGGATLAVLGERVFAATTKRPPAKGRSDAASAPSPAAALAGTRESLRRLVVSRALTVDDPWVLMHALLPLGAGAMHGKEPALDLVLRTWIEGVTVAGTTYPAFPARVEAHPNHFLEIMYAIDVVPERPFATKLGPVTRADLYRGAKALFSPATQGAELAWTVSVFTAEMAPDRDRFESGDGRSFAVSAVVEALAQAAESGYADTTAAMRGAKPYARSAVQEYACNGTHVIHGLLDALRHGYRSNRLGERVTALMQAALFRLGPEVQLIDQAIGASGKPSAALNADAAKLQFLGHSLENFALARRSRLYEPSASERAAVAGAERELAAVVGRLAGYDLDGLARDVPRAYREILGDACHALHGLEVASA